MSGQQIFVVKIEVFQLLTILDASQKIGRKMYAAHERPLESGYVSFPLHFSYFGTCV